VCEPKIPRRRVLAAGAAVGVGSIAAAVGIPLLRGEGDPAKVALPRAEPLRIDHVTVIDPLDGSRQEDVSVVVDGGRVTAVGRDLPASPAGSVVDGAGRFVVPGYVNMHTHVLQVDRPEAHLATMLAEGVTGMRQMAGSAQLLRYRAQGRLPLTEYAPALLAVPGDLLLPFRAGSAEQAREEVRRQRDQGADFIKTVLFDREVFLAAVDEAHAVGLPTAGHLPAQVTPEEAAAAGFSCLEHFGTGTPVWISCSTDRDALLGRDDTRLPVPNWVLGLPFVEKIVMGQMRKRLVNPAAFDDPETVALLRRALDTFDENRATELAGTWVGSGTWQVPTLVRLRTQFLADDPRYRQDPAHRLMTPQESEDWHEVLGTFTALPAQMKETYRLAYATTLRLTKICHDAGVRILTGTDSSGATPGQSMRLEFQEMAAAGLSALDLLRAATTAPAEFLGRTSRAGRVAVGMDADFLLLGADPVRDVANLSDVTAVVRAGHHLTREQITTRINTRLAGKES